MFRHFLFDVRQNDETGLTGLAMRGRNWAAPLGPMAAIHDIMEHGANDDGTVEGELMAMGASFLVRGEEYNAVKGSWRTSPGYHWAYELREQAERYMGGRTELRDPGKTRPITDYNGPEEWALEACEEARNSWDEDNGPLPEWLSEGQQWRIIGWVRRGYRKAFDRYNRRGIACYPGCLSQLYIQAEKAAEKACKYAEEGDGIRISIDFQRYDAKASITGRSEY